jgi:hypothetical protein
VYNRCLRKIAPPGGSHPLKTLWPLFVNRYFSAAGGASGPPDFSQNLRKSGRL